MPTAVAAAAARSPSGCSSPARSTRTAWPTSPTRSAAGPPVSAGSDPEDPRHGTYGVAALAVPWCCASSAPRLDRVLGGVVRRLRRRPRPRPRRRGGSDGCASRRRATTGSAPITRGGCGPGDAVGVAVRCRDRAVARHGWWAGPIVAVSSPRRAPRVVGDAQDRRARRRRARRDRAGRRVPRARHRERAGEPALAVVGVAATLHRFTARRTYVSADEHRAGDHRPLLRVAQGRDVDASPCSTRPMPRSSATTAWPRAQRDRGVLPRLPRRTTRPGTAPDRQDPTTTATCDVGRARRQRRRCLQTIDVVILDDDGLIRQPHPWLPWLLGPLTAFHASRDPSTHMSSSPPTTSTRTSRR